MPEQIKNLDRIRENILGPPSELTEHVTVLPDGTKTGGTRFQRGARANHVETGPNCYPLGLSYQKPRLIAAPQADNKVFEENDEESAMRSDIVAVSNV